MDIIDNIIDTTLNSFDFTLVIIINIATYVVIKFIDDFNGIKKVSIWVKRLVLLICAVTISLIYHFCDFGESKLILNSAILAPVFWSWFGKPLAKRFGIDYKTVDDLED